MLDKNDQPVFVGDTVTFFLMSFTKVVDTFEGCKVVGISKTGRLSIVHPHFPKSITNPTGRKTISRMHCVKTS